MKKVAVSACLLGNKCRYDATDNYDKSLIDRLKGCEIIPFCPEDYAFGSPRPTMDLIAMPQGIRAISNLTGEDLTESVKRYAEVFFKEHTAIDLFIGKDRSPSCGVCTAKLYDTDKTLLSNTAIGIMAQEAKNRGIETVDSEKFDDIKLKKGCS